MNHVRRPESFGNHESNAEIRYAKVTAILPAPEDSGDLDPYQPVQVKFLRFDDGYKPASSGIVDATSSDIAFKTRKSSQKHGERGNGITVTLAVDSGITPPATATFDEGGDTVAIKVKTIHVLWSDVISAVAIPLSGAFVLTAYTPGAEVGSGIASVTATLAGGVDGDYEPYGDQFGIGNPDTKDDVTVDDKIWIIRRGDSQRWEILTGSGGGGGASTLMILTEDCAAASGDLTGGVTAVKALASIAAFAFDGDDLKITRAAGEPVAVWNLDPGKTYLENQGVYVSDGSAGGTPFRKIDSSNCSIYVEGTPDEEDP